VKAFGSEIPIGRIRKDLTGRHLRHTRSGDLQGVNFMKAIRVLTVVSLGLFAGFFASPLKADSFNKATTVSIDNPVRVQNTVLLPGRYIFEIGPSQTDMSLVWIRNASNNHLVATIIGNSAYRPNPDGAQTLTFYHTAAGQLPTLKDWYFPGETLGVQFDNRNPAAPVMANNHTITQAGGPVGGMK
jgi:hypothetical protein